MPIIEEENLIHTKLRGVAHTTKSATKSGYLSRQNVLLNMYRNPELVNMVWLEMVSNSHDPSVSYVHYLINKGGNMNYSKDVCINWAGNIYLKKGIYNIGSVLDKYFQHAHNHDKRLFVCSWNITGFGKTYKTNKINDLLENKVEEEERFGNLGCNITIELNSK